MDIVLTELNRLFAPARKRVKAKIHHHAGVEIVRVKGLWQATIDGRVYRNSLLGDLKVQLDEVLA